MSKQGRIRNATNSASQTDDKARTDSGDPQDSPNEAVESTSKDEGSSPEASKERVEEKVTTKAAAIIIEPIVIPDKLAPPMCPHCHERRYPKELRGKAIRCTNCRTMQTLR